MRALVVAVSLLSLLATASSASAGRRVAVVVGNGAYTKLPALPNPVPDAQAMEGLLKSLDFDVVEAIDVTRDQLTARLLEFSRKAEGADIAAFYYSGQGLAVGGNNYLLPVDADIKSEMDIKPGGGVDLATTVEQTMGGADVRLVFFDASRNDPFAKGGLSPAKRTYQKGSARITGSPRAKKIPSGTLIGFATGSGQAALDGKAGEHSPFTRALLAHLAEPDVEIQQVMMMVRAQVNEETDKAQLPWGYTELVGEVYLKPVAVSPDASPAAK